MNPTLPDRPPAVDPGGPQGTLPSFDPNRFPLERGIQLLEASAGTGKTFALAHLVLRLVAERGLPLRRLLVVTFTDAAAAELRDRIDRRLQAALRHLAGSAVRDGLPAVDPVLEEWIAGRVANGDDPRTLRGRLLVALEDLDAADIITIHGFCRRTLLRQGLAGGLPPGLTLETESDTLLRQVVHDHWQQQVLPLPFPLLALLNAQGLSPGILHEALSRLDGDPALQLDPLPAALPSDQPLPRILPALLQERWCCFRREWQARGRALEEDFRSAAARWREAGARSTTPYSPKPRRDRCSELDTWLAALEGREDAEALAEALIGQDLLRSYFHPGAFSKVARGVEGDGEAPPSLPQRPLLEAVADLVDGPAELVALHACHRGRAELARRRRRAASAGFSQLLESLDPRRHGEAAERMLAGASARYDVALIDEFQDTDPIQWRILRKAFGGGAHQLVLVGDPKQAIYRFRGGDLNTYRRAAAAAGHRYGLTENHRATPRLVAALNRLMRPGLPRSDLTVPPVQARSRRRGPGQAPIELLWLGGERQAGEKLPVGSKLEDRLPAAIAAYTAALLRRRLELGETDPEGGSRRRRLEPGDVCLLVNTHRQAEELRAALERWGIASRLVSKADIFASPAATALQRFLDALADPADPGRMRLLAATPLMGWSAADIATAPADRWSALAGGLEQVARRLERRGLLGGLAEVLGGEGMARLSLGGRLLADLQQAAELVEEHLHAARVGPAAAADWLRRRRLDPDRPVPEAHLAHSDRVDGAVSVVTIHRSKGLEYPVVICPTLWQTATAAATARQHRACLRWQPQLREEPLLDLHRNRHWGRGHAAACANLSAEQAERERLAYVALTRAQHLLVLAWGPAAGHHGGPLLPWLFPEVSAAAPEDDLLRERSDREWRDHLEARIRECRLEIRLMDPPREAPLRQGAEPSAPREALVPGPLPDRRLDSGWGRHSYTSWTHSPSEAVAPEALEEGRDTGDPDLADPREPESGMPPPEEGPDLRSGPPPGPLAEFPRGARAGDCLHRILEQLDYDRPLEGEDSRSLVERELRRAGLPALPCGPVLEGLERMLRTPFGGPLGSFRAGDLPRCRRINEMPFDLCLDPVTASGLAAVFRAHPGDDLGPAYPGRLALLPANGRGFLTGSIDLVFTAPVFSASSAEATPRWWVADWKSNWLGRTDDEGRPLHCGPSTYGPAAMRELMESRHYVLQAHLYLVALHRYLGWRQRDYDPARDLGGYAYVFLRGTPGAAAELLLPGPVPGMVVERPPLARLLALDAALGGTGGGIR